MKRGQSPLRGLLSGMGNLLLAIVLALLVWVVAEREANPDAERTLPNAIPITLQNVPAGMMTYEPSARTVRVTLSAPESVWGVLTPDRVSAFIDLSGQVSGTLDLPVQVTVDNRTARVTKIDQPRVSLKMEPLTEAQFPVTVNVSGEPALGFASRPLATSPTTVTVRGPLSFVRQIASASGQTVDSGCAGYHHPDDQSLAPRSRWTKRALRDAGSQHHAGRGAPATAGRIS